jgi:hypothetical protein
MVLPDNKLTVNIKHTELGSGSFVVKAKTTNQRGEKVINGSAKVIQPNMVDPPGRMIMLPQYNNAPSVYLYLVY